MKNKENNQVIKLKILRKAFNISQKRIANELNVAQQSISRLEKEKIKSIKIKTLNSYAKALNGQLKVDIEIAGVRYPIL